MKKSLLALAVLGAFAGAASAQSSVTIFGIVDVALTRTKLGGEDAVSTMDSSGNLPSLFGFTGTEDLGGGLKVGFHLEGQLIPDSGGFAVNDGKFFDRRSTISLLGGFGELRLGRDFKADYLIEALFDPFTHVGVGNSLTGNGTDLLQLLGFGTLVTPVDEDGLGLISAPAFDYLWSDNIISYSLPSNLGGFYGQIQHAPGEGVADKKFTGGRVGYAAGPFDVTVGYSVIDGSDGAGEDFTRLVAAGSYDFGVAKVSLVYTQNEYDPFEQKTMQVGAWVPLGAGQFKFSYVKTELDLVVAEPEVSMFALGYVHNLSKRSAVYATYSNTDSDFRTEKSNAFQVGIRHIF